MVFNTTFNNISAILWRSRQTKSVEITDGFIYYADIEMSAFFISFLLQSLKLFILKKRNSIVDVAVSFIGGGNLTARRKPPTCRKSLRNLII
jgi:hypothetical protein